jgi:hypothetical protein
LPLLAIRKSFTSYRYRGQPFLIAATRIYVCQAQQKAFFISRKTAVVYFICSDVYDSFENFSQGAEEAYWPE